MHGYGPIFRIHQTEEGAVAEAFWPENKALKGEIGVRAAKF